VRSSHGHSVYTYVPDVSKSFNRGYTEYNLHEKKECYANFKSPKSVGTEVAQVVRNSGRQILVKPLHGQILHNGDKCNYFNTRQELDGFRVSSVKGQTLEIFQPVSELKPGMILYRNKDAEFERKILENGSAVRRLRIDFTYTETPDRIILEAVDETGDRSQSVMILENPEPSKNFEKMEQNLRSKLAKLGESIFECGQLTLDLDYHWFIPVSRLNELRHDAMEAILSLKDQRRTVSDKKINLAVQLPEEERNLGFQANIYNELARKYYFEHGELDITDAYEKIKQPGAPVLYSKHCLQYCFGMCRKRNLKRRPEKLELVIGNHCFRLDFDCERCMMILRDRGFDK
jgi:putative protease